jgi:hypothetical protein
MATADTDAITVLGEGFPGWCVWRGRDGDKLASWYATRRERLTDMEYCEGLYRTLAADDPNGLREQLEEQADIEARL